MYRARIFSEDDQLLDVLKDTIPELVKECSKFFIAFDSAPVIRRSLERAGAYAKAYQGVRQEKFDKLPCFVHVTLANPISKA